MATTEKNYVPTDTRSPAPWQWLIAAACFSIAAAAFGLSGVWYALAYPSIGAVFLLALGLIYRFAKKPKKPKKFKGKRKREYRAKLARYAMGRQTSNWLFLGSLGTMVVGFVGVLIGSFGGTWLVDWFKWLGPIALLLVAVPPAMIGLVLTYFQKTGSRITMLIIGFVLLMVVSICVVQTTNEQREFEIQQQQIEQHKEEQKQLLDDTCEGENAELFPAECGGG